jgi:hypothetical protein
LVEFDSKEEYEDEAINEVDGPIVVLDEIIGVVVPFLGRPGMILPS